MQLHGSFQDLRQGDASIAMYMQQAKSLFDELAAASWPISLEDFNLYLFYGLHGEFKYLVTNLEIKAEPLSYGDASIAMYMQQAKSLFDELAAASWPISLEDFNLYVFYGLHGEFKYLVTNLEIKAKPLSYADLHGHLLTHEFLHKTSLQSMAANPPLFPTSSLLPSTHLA
jgi:hypothetical protein